MDQTTRALAVLAAATLILAPLVNGILSDAAATADRLFLQNADWEADPPLPEEYEGEPPEDPPEGEMERNGTQAQGRAPTCQIQEEPTEAVWHHANVTEQDQAQQAVASRVVDPQTKTFTVTDDHIGLGVELRIEELYGSVTARVYPEGAPDQAVFEYERSNALGDDPVKRSTETRPELTSGTWVAELDYHQASYSNLTFGVVLASCQGAGAEGSA